MRPCLNNVPREKEKERERGGGTSSNSICCRNTKLYINIKLCINCDSYPFEKQLSMGGRKQQKVANA